MPEPVRSVPGWVWLSGLPLGLGAWAPLVPAALVGKRGWALWGTLWSLLALAGWVVAMVACFRQGFVVLTCNEQLRPKDLRLRLAACPPALVICDERNAAVLADAGWSGETIVVPAALPEREPPAAAELDPADPCLITFTSGTAGEPKAVVHGQRYLGGQRLQAEHWLAPRPGDLVWCTAASGWSKSARNAFIAPWLRGAAALLHDARFDPAERLELLEREGVNVLCMAPTEYRVIAKRATLRPVASLRGLVAAGEAKAKKASLVAAELPGWKATPHKKSSDGSDPRCSYYNPDQSDLVEVGPDRNNANTLYSLKRVLLGLIPAWAVLRARAAPEPALGAVVEAWLQRRVSDADQLSGDDAAAGEPGSESRGVVLERQQRSGDSAAGA